MVFNTALVLSTFLLIIVSINAQTQDYCVNDTNSFDKHTMCKYPSEGISAECSRNRNGMSLPTNYQDQQIVVEKHNEYRTTVALGWEKSGAPGPQPMASNMNELSWDPELAKVAQRWADQCIPKHDQRRQVDRFQVGQNVYEFVTTGPATKPDYAAAIKGWYDEVELYPNYDVANFKSVENRGKEIGHYTQVLWAETHSVGCGAVSYKEGNQNKWKIVCNYGPAGNWFGQEVYMKGPVCSRCSESRDSCTKSKGAQYAALCSRPRYG